MMIRRSTYALIFAVLLLVAGMLLSPINAADEASALPTANADLQVVTYASGLTGFFDPSNRTLYLYGADLKTPFMTVQVETLGEPLKVLKGPEQ